MLSSLEKQKSEKKITPGFLKDFKKKTITRDLESASKDKSRAMKSDDLLTTLSATC